MRSDEAFQIAQQIESLPFKEKVCLIEEIARMLRRPTPEEEAREQADLIAMADVLNRAQDEEREQGASRRELGRYIVVDPEICHGKPTFRGTRIMVAQVLKQVARGMDWEEIVKEWRGDVPPEAIAEAVELASRMFAEHADEYGSEALPA